MDFIEVSAKTVNDAITKACIELGMSSDRLDIQVITEGSTGFLGFGSKPAVIKVRQKEEPVEEKTEVIAPAKPTADKKSFVKKASEKPEKAAPVQEKTTAKPVKKEKAVSESRTEKTVRAEQAPRAERPARGERSSRPDRGERNGKGRRDNRREMKKEVPVVKETARKESVPKKEYVVVPKTEEEVAAMKSAAEKFLLGVFRVMELPVEISMNYDAEAGCLEINFDGVDMGVLIGKRGQTLDSLQYLTSLVVNKEQKDYVRVKLDTEDYRKRRKETLENLAKNIAYKVKRTRKPVSLEPMNPYERRIIHSALQSNKYVETYSEGNEPYRHIVVTLKK